MKRFNLFLALNLALFIQHSNAQWTNLNAPNSSNENYSTIAVSDNGKNIAAYTTKLNMTTFQTTYHYTTSHDYGATWQVFSVPDTAGLLPFEYYNTAPLDIFWDGDNLFVQDANPTTTLKKSTDFGASFTNQNTTYTTQSKIIKAPGGNWYHFNAGNLYSSTDNGASWSSLGTGGTGFMEYTVAANGNLVATYAQGVAYSSDGGNTWTPSTFSTTDTWVDSKNSISKASDGTLLYMCKTGTRIYQSIDNGVSWQLISSSLPVNPIKMLFSGTDIITLSTNSSTHKSINGGVTFSQMTPASGGILNTGNAMTNSLTDIYISGMSAIYKYNSAFIGIAENTLTRNIHIYPNPSNSLITLKSDTNLNAYSIRNLLGEVVMENKTTSNQQTIDISELPAGNYLITLYFSDATTAGKLVVKE